MSKQKFDAVVFSEAFKATVQLYQGPFVVFPDQPGICHQLRSERLHLSLRSFARGRGERLNENRIKDVLDELDAFAFEDGLPVVAHYRVAPYLAGYIYNLGGGRFLQVTRGKLEHIKTLPAGVYFTETSTMLAAPELAQQTDLKALLGWFNCTVDQKLLLLAWLTYTVATPKAAQLPYPILVVRAPAGSGKTFMCSKVIRQLVDPCRVASQTMPRAIKDVAISAQNSHALIYDNLRFIRHELSDGLCQVATGGSTVGRKLYTDGQEFSMDLRCALVLNGIHTFLTESDLVSRCVNINLAPIGSEQRLSEAELSAKFDEQLPSLIYTLHVLAAKVLAAKDSVEITFKSRMADFSVWIAGLETVLKLPQDQLQDAYRKNVEQAKVAGVVDDSLFVALCNFATRYPKTSSWHGTPHELLSALEAQTAVSLGSDMPKNAAAMSRRLSMLQDALASNGVHVVRGKASVRYYDVWFEPKASQSRGECDDVAAPSVTPTQPSREDQSCEENDGVAESLLG
ncbi:hypothetical protein [Aeromonas allosaccharophila]|uniref:hypothetical protein n=1 Tax=Aeromonas allosaccharophila TaxID=656 RepID=UPI002ADF132F|nr:hypothetical protein [Aeromonas allosaccharophila]